VASLHLTKARARSLYVCTNCGGAIAKGTVYFRNDPPFGSWLRGQQVSHWCRECILSSLPEAAELVGRFVVPAVRVVRTGNDEVIQPVCIELLPFAALLSRHIGGQPELIHQLTPEQFEQFICEQLFAMGFEPKRVGKTNQADGGIDILSGHATPQRFLSSAQPR